MKDNLNILEIISGISQVVGTKGHDGALEDDGTRVKIGLGREEGHLINDSRVVDGFGIKFQGNKIKISYQAEIKLEDVHDSKFESELEDKIESIVKFIKKEYKKLTKNTLGIKKDEGEMKATVQTTSRVRAFVHAHKWYVLTGLPDSKEMSKDEHQEKLDKALKSWMDMKAPTYKDSTKNEKKDSDRFTPWNYSNENTEKHKK